MSTNYYLKRIPTEEEIAECHRLLDERKIDTDDLCDEKYHSPCLESVFAKITEKIHLGKYSDGWRFLFRTETTTRPGIPLMIFMRNGNGRFVRGQSGWGWRSVRKQWRLFLLSRLWRIVCMR